MTISELGVTSNIIVSGEPTFELVEWRVTTATSTGVNPIAWNPPGTTSQQGKAGATLSLKDPEDCVYVLLRQVEEEETPAQDYNYLIPQSSITRRIWFSAPDNQLSMPKIQDHEFTWAIPAHNPAECPGHNYTVEETKKDADGNAEKNDDGSEKKETVTKTDYCTGWKWWDNGGAHQLHLSIHNDNWNDYHDILATKTTQFRSDAGDEVEKQKLTKRWYNNQVFSRADPAGSAQQYKETNWDYICVIMRGKDKLTLAEWVNAGESKAPSTQANDDLANASSSGFSVGNTPAGTRKTQMYFETFSANFVNESEGRGADNKTQWGPETAAPHSGGKCPKTWTEIVLSPLAISSIVVKVDTYSGDPAGGVADADCNHADMNLGWFGGLGSTSNMSINSGRMVESGGTISFYPYIQMKYDIKTEKAKQAFVLGQYSRGIIPNDYAEISWNPTGSNPNLTLISPQWSLHATAKKDFGADQVLPGGATLGLGIKKQDRQTVVVTTYQCIVEDKGKVQVDKTGGSDGGLDEAQAVSAHEAYVASVVSALENTHVEQYVDKNGEASDAFGGIIVYPGASISALNNKQAEGKASTDDKYYFRNNNTTTSGSNEGDYDVQNRGTVSKKYIFRSDTEGQILMNDGVILSKTADASAVGGEAKQLDDRTYVVRKLVKAIERNTGVDNGAPNSFDPVEVPKWAPDGAWYNEAFDGITVIVQRTELIVGFIDPPERTQVLDPRLIPWTQNKGDMLNSSGNKRDDYNTCQFKTRKYSEDYGSGHPEVMGTFKDVDVKMRNLEKLFWSRPFRIPNMTTQDLR